MGFRLWVDTGHQNKDSGAVGGGLTEVQENDELADQIEIVASWQPGWVVGSTNEKDAYTSNIERVRDAINFRADLALSIHHDWINGRQAVIYPNNHDVRESTGFAKYISSHIDPLAPTDSIIYPDRRGLTFLTNTPMPAVLVEAARVQDGDHYDERTMAIAIVKGICAAKGWEFHDEPKEDEDVPAKNVLIQAFVRPDKANEAVKKMKDLGLRAYIVDPDAARITRENPDGDPQ